MRHVLKKKIRVNRKISVPISVALMVGLLCVGVFAYLSTSGRTVSQLQPAPEVTLTVDDTYAVSVTDCKYAVYIRAAVTVNWVNGNLIYAHAPEAGTDYSITFDTENWFYHNGFYYYKKPVASNGATSNLLSGFKQSDKVTAPKDYTLSLTMVAQAIQAKGTTDDGDNPAVTDAWGITIDGNGNLVVLVSP